MFGLANDCSDNHQRQIDRVQLKEYLRVYDQESHRLLGYVQWF